VKTRRTYRGRILVAAVRVKEFMVEKEIGKADD
jgi:hypothetical protein